jgi:chromosome partitioning protein
MPVSKRSPELQSRDMGRVLAISNQKGGVGKTTTAINLAASLAAGEQRTLLVDCDPQGNASSGLGIQARELPLTVYDVLSGRATWQDARQTTALRYLDVLPANRELAGAEVELVNVDRREYRLEEALGAARADYSYLVIDCPPALGLLTLNALTAADAVVIPLQCEYFALEGLSELMHTIELVRKGLNPGLEIEGVLLTMFDGRISIANQVAEEARRHFEGRVFKTVIPRNVRLSECPSFGKPILLYDLRSKGCESYLSLAREIQKRHESPQTGAA